MTTELSKLPPPYMSHGVFKSTVDHLSENTVPTGPLDRRVLDGLSGADHGALISGLKFLGYIDDERKATNTYRQLVEASKDVPQFKTRLLEVVNEKYRPVIGDLNVQTGTITDLEKAFKAYGVPPGQMLTKTIRFYLKVLSECGVPLSPHITKAKPRAPRISPKKNERTPPPNKDGGANNSGSADLLPKGYERMSVPGLRDAFIQYPLSLTDAQCNLFAAMITTLRAFAKGQVTGKEGIE